MSTFCYDDDGKIEWESSQNEINCIEKISFEECRIFYKNLLAPQSAYKNFKRSLTPEVFQDFQDQKKDNKILQSLNKKFSFENLILKGCKSEVSTGNKFDFKNLADKLNNNKNIG